MPVYSRYLEERLRQCLSDTRVVLLTGPRQAGKTTLAKHVATSGKYLSLDDPTTLAAARTDPVSFIRALDRAVIAEIQRAPELVLAIKRSVDTNQQPGRFLITGSANLLTVPQVADSLAGRMAILELLPLSAAEIRNQRSTFLPKILAGQVPTPIQPIVGDDLVALVSTGGYPEAVGRTSWARRRDWYLDYVRAIVERDVRDLTEIAHLQQMPRLLRATAHHSGQLINYSQLGATLGLNHVTTQKYSGFFERLFLTRLLPAWSTNELKRLVKTPKVHFLDSGLLCAMLDLSPARVSNHRAAFGPVLESFVLSEILKLASWIGERLELTHFRDKEQNEVDIVIENHERKVIGIEVKSAATVTASDFAGLRRLADASRDRFALGLVLYDETQIVPFGPKLFAAPISCLWS